MEGAVKVLAKRGPEYLIEFPDDIEWVASPPNHPLVLKFLETYKAPGYKLPSISLKQMEDTWLRDMGPYEKK